MKGTVKQPQILNKDNLGCHQQHTKTIINII